MAARRQSARAEGAWLTLSAPGRLARTPQDRNARDPSIEIALAELHTTGRGASGTISIEISISTLIVEPEIARSRPDHLSPGEPDIEAGEAAIIEMMRRQQRDRAQAQIGIICAPMPTSRKCWSRFFSLSVAEPAAPCAPACSISLIATAMVKDYTGKDIAAEYDGA